MQEQYRPISNSVYSSYQENDLGETLFQVVLALKPKKIIEFGVLYGYSAIAMAQALKCLGRGKIIGYDLWEEYPYRHAKKNQAQAFLQAYGVDEFVELRYGDFARWNPEEFDLMHLDISNDGDTIRKASEFAHIGTIIFEGGSVARDNVEWMHKYKKKKITECGVPYKILNPEFPSISMIC